MEFPVTDNEILGLIREALAEVAPSRSAEFTNVTLETKLSDLKLDSVSAMEMVGSVEERIQATFPDERLAQLNTFSDLAALVREANTQNG